MDLKSFLLITFVIHIVRFAYAVPVSITSNEKDEECQTKWSIITPSNLNAIYGENLKSGSKITQKILIGRCPNSSGAECTEGFCKGSLQKIKCSQKFTTITLTGREGIKLSQRIPTRCVPEPDIK